MNTFSNWQGINSARRGRGQSDHQGDHRRRSSSPDRLFERRLPKLSDRLARRTKPSRRFCSSGIDDCRDGTVTAGPNSIRAQMVAVRDVPGTPDIAKFNEVITRLDSITACVNEMADFQLDDRALALCYLDISTSAERLEELQTVFVDTWEWRRLGAFALRPAQRQRLFVTDVDVQRAQRSNGWRRRRCWLIATKTSSPLPRLDDQLSDEVDVAGALTAFKRRFAMSWTTTISSTRRQRSCRRREISANP